MQIVFETLMKTQKHGKCSLYLVYKKIDKSVLREYAIRTNKLN